jgi:hypothetical protein
MAVYRMMIFFLINFHPTGELSRGGQAGGFHLLRYLPAIASRSGEAGGLKARNPAYSGMASPLSAPLCGMKHLILFC